VTLGFPCSSDSNCIAHKCNVVAGRCKYPCQSNDDCQQGYLCKTPLCLPGQ
jgi:hypothetical protein